MLSNLNRIPGCFNRTNRLFPLLSPSTTSNLSSRVNASFPVTAFEGFAKLSFNSWKQNHLVTTSLSPPSYNEILKHVVAVHATKRLPNDGVLKPLSNIDDNVKKYFLIANNIHFSLGELARPIHTQSWEECPYAVITPLKTLMPKLLNLSAQDTFIHRELILTEESTLVVPEKTNLSSFTGKVTIVTYDPTLLSLRKAVDAVIKQNKRWALSMPDHSYFLGSEALFNNKNINTPDFFKELFKRHPGKFSFGDHCHSMIGDAYLLGWIRFLSYVLFASKNDAEKYVSFKILDFFYSKAKDKYFTEEEQKIIEDRINEKKKEILNRKDIYQPIWFYMSADLFHAMTWNELMIFQKENPDLFSSYNKHEFEGSWAAARWLTLGYEAGLKEDLDSIMDSQFKQYVKAAQIPTHFSLTLKKLLEIHNKKSTDRLEVVEAILKIEGAQEYISYIRKNFGREHNFPELVQKPEF